MQEAWLVVGNFNDIAYSREKKGGVSASYRKCNIFKDRIEKYSLIDICSVGDKFAWQWPM